MIHGVSVLALTAAGTVYGVADLQSPKAHGGWIVDKADAIPAAAEAALDRRLTALERETSVEITVVTVPDVEGTPKEFATELFNRWGVGKRGADNGLLFLLVRDRRRLEMETGYGLEATLPDGWLGTMQNDRMVPRFRAGDFGGGLEAGVAAVEARLRAAPEARGDGAAPRDRPAVHLEADPAAPAESRRPARGPGGGWLFGGAFAVLAGAWFIRERRRQRTCPQCKIRMHPLSEVADDEHLDATQELEERIGSVDYEVVVCEACQFTRTFPHTRWFSSYSRCNQCKARTLLSRSTTLAAATYDHGGKVQVNESCRNCSFNREYIRRTPRLVRSSSGFSGGRSSGGGSFGGGRSGGGGAGSSW